MRRIKSGRDVPGGGCACMVAYSEACTRRRVERDEIRRRLVG